MPAGEQILPQVYDELRKVARARMMKFGPGQTLEPTALVHEAFVRLKRRGDVSWDGRGHFFFAAARAMQDILIETARRKGAKKRGGDLQRVYVTFTLGDDEEVMSPEKLLSLHNALEEMQRTYPDHVNIVLLSYFCGLKFKEIAEIVGTTVYSVEGKLRFARAWLHKRLERE